MGCLINSNKNFVRARVCRLGVFPVSTTPAKDELPRPMILVRNFSTMSTTPISDAIVVLA
jgi:hypothetical protein